MKTLSEIYKELGIDFSFPIKIWDANGRVTYSECSDGFWERYERDANGDVTYYENSYGIKQGTTQRAQLDALGDKIKDAGLDSADYNGNQTYFETSNGVKQGIPKSTN